jgi:hypothetical protein
MEEKFKEGVDMILLQWPIYYGALDSRWNEFDKKTMRLLPSLMDCKKYDFSKMSYADARKVFVDELVDYVFGRFAVK